MTKKIKYSEQQKKLATYAKALGHPARVYILERLSGLQSCCTSGEMISDIPIARSTLSQHLSLLKQSGLIQGETEPPKIKYCINHDNWYQARNLFKELLSNTPKTSKKKC